MIGIIENMSGFVCPHCSVSLYKADPTLNTVPSPRGMLSTQRHWHAWFLGFELFGGSWSLSWSETCALEEIRWIFEGKQLPVLDLSEPSFPLLASLGEAAHLPP